MKKLLLLILPVLAITFNSCSKNDGGDIEYNKFTINGQVYEFNRGEIEYWVRENDPSEATFITLYIGYENGYAQENSPGIEISINVPKGNTKLDAGTYPFIKYDDKVFVCSEGWADVENVENKFTGGIITVAVSKNIYTITINCTLGDEGTVKGTYKGALQIFKG